MASPGSLYNCAYLSWIVPEFLINWAYLPWIVLEFLYKS